MPLTPADLIVEDGTGKPDANSFVDLAFLDGYHRLQNATAWEAATEHQKVAAAIQGTRFAALRWVYIGKPATDTQALPWPRRGALRTLRDAFGLDVEGTVPRQVKEATAEYALRALAGDLEPDPVTSAPYPVAETFEQVGPIVERTVWNTKGARQPAARLMPAADRILLRSGLVLSFGNRCVRG